VAVFITRANMTTLTPTRCPDRASIILFLAKLISKREGDIPKNLPMQRFIEIINYLNRLLVVMKIIYQNKI